MSGRPSPPPSTPSSPPPHPDSNPSRTSLLLSLPPPSSSANSRPATLRHPLHPFPTRLSSSSFPDLRRSPLISLSLLGFRPANMPPSSTVPAPPASTPSTMLHRLLFSFFLPTSTASQSSSISPLPVFISFPDESHHNPPSSSSLLPHTRTSATSTFLTSASLLFLLHAVAPSFHHPPLGRHLPLTLASLRPPPSTPRSGL